MPQGNKPLFSIIVSAYNVEDYISQCLDSVFAQSFQDFELIIVDDGSSDGTGSICDKYAKNQPHTSIVAQNSEKVNRKIAAPAVTVIHQPNAGLSAARNTGVAKASGEYLIFLDGDDYLELGALSAIQRGLEPELDLLRYQAQEVFADGKIVRHDENGFTTTTGAAAFRRLSRCYYVENAWLYTYRRAFFLENHFQYAPGRLSEDFGLTPLILARAQKVKAISDICYNYRQRAGSIMHDSAKTLRRTTDILAQLEQVLPQIATTPHTAPILHYLVVSFLYGTTELSRAQFLEIYQSAKQAGLLKYIHPHTFRALPRSWSLKYLPTVFYRLYHH